MIHLFATRLALFALLAAIDVPELEPFDRDEFDDAFDRLHGQSPDRSARKRAVQARLWRLARRFPAPPRTQPA